MGSDDLTLHVCHAINCGAPTQARMLFCLPHWRMVPKPVQSAVWHAYRRGQERDKRPSAFYVAVQRVAVACVATQTGALSRDAALGFARDRIYLLGSRLDAEWRDHALRLLHHVPKEPAS